MTLKTGASVAKKRVKARVLTFTETTVKTYEYSTDAETEDVALDEYVNSSGVWPKRLSVEVSREIVSFETRKKVCWDVVEQESIRGIVLKDGRIADPSTVVATKDGFESAIGRMVNNDYEVKHD